MAIHRRTGLARALSKLGYSSRSQAANLILAGHVTLNRHVVRDPERPVRLGVDAVEVHGHAVGQAELIYLAMNKPRGVVTTASDEKRRDTVYNLLPHGTPWVGPVGRLDKASEGLLLLTNDSAWASAITDPARHVNKTYHVQVDHVVDASLLARIAQGSDENKSSSMVDDDLRAKSAQLLRHGEKNSWLEITLDQGRNRQIRRLLASFNLEVLRLVRVSIGPIRLGDLAKASVRKLTEEEKESIYGLIDSIRAG